MKRTRVTRAVRSLSTDQKWRLGVAAGAFCAAATCVAHAQETKAPLPIASGTLIPVGTGIPGASPDTPIAFGKPIGTTGTVSVPAAPAGLPMVSGRQTTSPDISALDPGFVGKPPLAIATPVTNFAASFVQTIAVVTRNGSTPTTRYWYRQDGVPNSRRETRIRRTGMKQGVEEVSERSSDRTVGELATA